MLILQQILQLIDPAGGLIDPVVRVEEGLSVHGFDVADVRHGDFVLFLVRDAGKTALPGFYKLLDFPDLFRDLAAADQDQLLAPCSDLFDTHVHAVIRAINR